jgi:hypothetical protein
MPCSETQVFLGNLFSSFFIQDFFIKIPIAFEKTNFNFELRPAKKIMPKIDKRL